MSMTLSSKALYKSHGQDSSYFEGWEEYKTNPYNEITNPSGIIQMGLAENQLSFDLLESWLEKNPDVTRFKKEEGSSMFRELALFQDYHGLQAFKKFMAEIRERKVIFDPDNLVLTAGATSANETIMFCLADPGEAILIPTPYYPGSSSNGFRITKNSIEKVYQQARDNNIQVKAMFITNPSNPLGTTMTNEELSQIIQFSISNNLHIVSDEIYSGTVFNTPSFISILEALHFQKGHEIWDRVHLVSSLSKDLGLPGFRIGMIYSNNKALISAATKMSSFGLISSQTQYLLSKILADKEFMKIHREENKKRLKMRQESLVSGLNKCGIECLKGNAGLFCWVDFRNLLKSNTFEAELNLWKIILREVRLNICPGSSCHCVEPGWFRICFANMKEKTLDLAVQRIKAWVINSLGRGRDLGNICDAS
ncbi:hypothetical protein Leryth_013937 [Lithospermum erythrorhizon]|nr:hypothetical protein Leryth_013937 [Lithospermum erythrorhizon]